MKRMLFLLFSLALGVFSNSTMAFECKANGVSLGGGTSTSTFDIPIDVVVERSGDGFILTDMAKYTTCNGVGPGYQDALRTNNATISSLLVAKGYTGFLSIANSTPKPFPVGAWCVWPDTNCSVKSGTFPLQIKIGMTMRGFGTPGALVIPAGSEIARLGLDQRSYNTWYSIFYWRFILRNDLVIPSYTCDVDHPNLDVSLSPAEAEAVIAAGPGRYTAVKKKFTFGLTCEPQTYVSAEFSGTTMPGRNDVLENTTKHTGGNKNIGIQILHAGTPVVFGESKLVIPRSRARETIDFEAYYYYKGGELNGGPVTAIAYYVLNYQ